jgi:hypothetical protein
VQPYHRGPQRRLERRRKLRRIPAQHATAKDGHKAMTDNTLTDCVAAALKAIKAIELTAGRIDKRVEDAERRATEAEEEAERDRSLREGAVGALSAVQQEVNQTLGAWAQERAILLAEKKQLARCDREAREGTGAYASHLYRQAEELKL